MCIINTNEKQTKNTHRLTLYNIFSKKLVRFEKYAQHLLIYLYLIRNLHFDKYVQFVLKV
jgi:hypothetical protein